MQFSDIYDFNINENKDDDGISRTSSSEKLVRFADRFLMGTDFNVTGPKVKVTQSSNQKYASWFYGWRPKDQPNLLSDE